MRHLYIQNDQLAELQQDLQPLPFREGQHSFASTYIQNDQLAEIFKNLFDLFLRGCGSGGEGGDKCIFKFIYSKLSVRQEPARSSTKFVFVLPLIDDDENN